MEITLHHSTRELVEAMSQFEPSTQFVTSSLTYLRGELAPEQSRTEAEYHTVYALVQGDNPPPDIYPVVNDALIRYAAEPVNEDEHVPHNRADRRRPETGLPSPTS